MNNPFTNLSNFFLPDQFNQEVTDRIRKAALQNTAISVATLDLEHFNYINDLFGYDTGDVILRKLTEYFSATLQKEEIFTRCHADIFAFCLPFTAYEDVSRRFYTLTDWQDILHNILPPHYRLNASGGIVIVSDTTTPVSALLDKANYARKKAKENPFNNFLYYDEKMSQELKWQKIVTFSMETALENEEFQVYLQPKVFIKTNQIIGAEALVRWSSPRHGLIVPDRFIPIMEQNGFIQQLDFYMLEKVCRYLKECSAAGLPQIPISVNFSRTHLNTNRLAERIFRTVNRLGIHPGLIEIEFTESLSVDRFERLIEVTTDLKHMGFKVSLDDFGSAYSSLNCLKELPIDIIKIDKGFLRSSSESEKGKLIIAKMVELIKALHMFSVVEGVETNEQAIFLKKLSCDFGQGYFYAKPMPADAYTQYLQTREVLLDIPPNTL